MIVGLRMLSTVIRGALAQPIDVLDESRISLRVLPNDVDYNLHLNNGRFLTIMDLGRTDWGMRARAWPRWMKLGWKPLAGSVTIRFDRSIEAMAGYELRSRIVCWDHKWTYFQQEFWNGEQRAAVAYVKVVLKHGRRTVPPARAMAAMGLTDASPTMPAGVRHWLDSDAA